MKSKQACFDPALARMALRRFAPIWAVYTAALVLTTFFVVSDGGGDAGNILENVNGYMQVMVGYNFVYAFALAQLLFGDLYTPRLCYALHAMPVSRSAYYGTQIILGILGSLVPNVLNAGLLVLLMKGFRLAAFWWLMASMGQFLFFYGVAALSAVCAGNRFGQMLICGIINFLGVLLWWFQVRLYIPLLYGLTQTSSSGLLRLSPAVAMTNLPLQVVYEKKVTPYMDYFRYAVRGFHVNSGYFVHLTICSMLGIAAIWLGMKLYKKRDLECAGDTLAFPQLKPVFLLLFTLTCGGFAHLAAWNFHESFGLPLLFIGLIVGYYVGQMLLLRQVNVFRVVKKLPIAVLCLVILVSVMLTNLDVLGVSQQIPNAEDVAKVEFDSWDTMETVDSGDIQTVLDIQKLAIRQRQERFDAQPLWRRLVADTSKELPEYTDGDIYRGYAQMTINYTMKDGSYIRREYPFNQQSEEVPLIRKLSSRPDIVFGDVRYAFPDRKLDLETMLDEAFGCEVVCSHDRASKLDEYEGIWRESEKSSMLADAAEVRSLLDAIVQDCREGNMSQSWILHEEESFDYLVFSFRTTRSDTPVYSANIQVYPDNVHTVNWLKAHGYHE